jgi:dTDP-4-amino-4,6-dideoxygalactose transaminase
MNELTNTQLEFASNVLRSSASSPKKPFPFLDLKAQFEKLRPEMLAAIMRVLESQHFILGPEVEQLEREFAPMAGCDYAIGCASGSDALLLALMALGVKPGDEVITTPFTFIATAGCIARLQARPVFVDINPETFNLDPAHLEEAVTPRTRGIIAVHLYGLPAAMNAILDIAERHKLFVLEDAAQAVGAQYHGRPVGSLGAIGCFSFFPSKNLGGAGDGGMLTTNDPNLAEQLRTLRVHGCREKYQAEVVGINSRLDALQAAILRVKLPYLNEWTAARRRNAERYCTLFRETGLDQSIRLPSTPSNSVHVFNQFVIRTPNRDHLRQQLQRAGIPSEIYYPSPLHLQRAFLDLNYKAGDFVEAEAASREALALPIYPELEEEQLMRVIEEIAGFYTANAECLEMKR